MVKHVMMAVLRDNSAENLEKAKELLLSMKGRVPQIIEIRVGTDFLKSERSYDIILEVTLTDRDALDEYQRDEYHCKIVKPFMHAERLDSVTVDYYL